MTPEEIHLFFARIIADSFTSNRPIAIIHSNGERAIGTVSYVHLLGVVITDVTTDNEVEIPWARIEGITHLRGRENGY